MADTDHQKPVVTGNVDGEVHRKIQQWCQSPESISTVCAKDPSKSIGDISKELYWSHNLQTIVTKGPTTRRRATPEDLAWARSCGKFGGTQPSELFLRAYHDLLQCLEKDPLANCASPSLTGSTGSCPLTIIAPLNDQLRHMSNLIVRARKEVLLATNFFKSSGASTFINDALREVSKRAGERGDKIVVKLMYDRGALKQFVENHQVVPVKTYAAEAVNLPKPEEIPNVDLQVVNFHKPPLGTFHSKFMIVDRQIATVSSNNIQDNDNVEMMTHLEGPIVDSLWETFLVSFHVKLEPAAPFITTPAAAQPAPTYQEKSFTELFESNGSFRLPERPTTANLPEHMPNEPHYDDSIASEIDRMRSVLRPADGESHEDAVARHLNKPTDLSVKASAPAREPNLHFFPFIPIANSGPVPMAMASRKPYANINNESEFVPQNEAFLSLIRNAQRTIFIQTPDLNAKPLTSAITEACKRGVEVTYYVCLGYNDTGELLPGQNGTNEMFAHDLYSKLETAEEKAKLRVFYYTAADQDHPIHNSFKQRSCHIKLLIADESVSIQGSGNQDTQSWFHSQEVNVMIDSEVVAKQWREGIERNQNTAQFGRARDDGCWYDKDGKLAEGSYGFSVSKMDRIKGVAGILKKAQGK